MNGSTMNANFSELSAVPLQNETTLYGVDFYGPGDGEVTLTDEQLIKLMGPIRKKMTTVIPMTIIYIVIFLTGVVGNVCTCIVIQRNRYMHTATNFYLFSLAISDLLLLLLGLPAEFYELWFSYPYIFGNDFCVIRGLCAETSANASILTITAFTIERYVAICHPIKAHTISRPPRAVKCIILVWFVATMCAIPLALQFGVTYKYTDDGRRKWQTAQCAVVVLMKHAFEISTFLFFCLPTAVIVILYIFIGIRLRRPSDCVSGGRKNSSDSSNAVKSHSFLSSNQKRMRNGQQANNNSRQYGGNSRRAVIKMLVGVVVSFVLCWSPFHAQRLMAIYAIRSSDVFTFIYQILLYISGVTYYLSATINPILYHIMSVKFRQAFRDTFFKHRLCSCCCREKRRTRLSISSCTMTSQVATDCHKINETNLKVVDNKHVKICQKLISKESKNNRKEQLRRNKSTLASSFA